MHYLVVAGDHDKAVASDERVRERTITVTKPHTPMKRSSISKSFKAIWKCLLKPFDSGNREVWREHFDPIYGLPYPALNDWLARNPNLREKYDAELKARLTTLR